MPIKYAKNNILTSMPLRYLMPFLTYEDKMNLNDNLHEAAESVDLDAVYGLIEERIINFNLYTAAEGGDLNMVRKFIDQGNDVNIQDKHGKTPLHYAAGYGQLEVVQELVKNGADINAKDNLNTTPLHYAARDGHFNVVQELIATKKVDVNAQDENGYTPLHEAAINGKLGVVRVLIKKKADPNAKNNNGKTPLDLARENNKNDIIEFLTPKRTRREAYTSNSTARIATPHQVSGHPQIQHLNGQGNNSIALPEVNSTVVGNATMLLELIARKFTGKKYAPSVGPLSKDKYVEERVDSIEQVLKGALNKYSEQPRTHLDNISVKSNVTTGLDL